MPNPKRITSPNADEIERVLRSPEVRRLTRRVLRAQADLRRLLADDGWRAFLTVEELTVARNALALAVIAKWAFGRGVKRRRSLTVTMEPRKTGRQDRGQRRRRGSVRRKARRAT